MIKHFPGRAAWLVLLIGLIALATGGCGGSDAAPPASPASPPADPPPPPRGTTTQTATARSTFTFDAAGLFANSGSELAAFDATGLPATLKIDADGLINGVPAESDVGEHQVEVTADDGQGGQAAVTLALTVNAGAPAELGAALCTEVLGFSQTSEWYDFLTLPWQARIDDDADLATWADPSDPAWDVEVRGRVCEQSEVGRVVLNVSSTSITGLDGWVAGIDGAIENIRNLYPAVEQIVLQPVVGGAGAERCPADGGDVRASSNHVAINLAIRTVVARHSDVLAGLAATVADCAQYFDAAGNLTTDGAQYVAAEMDAFYGAATSQLAWVGFVGSQGSAADWADLARGVARASTGMTSLSGPPFSEAEIEAQLDTLEETVESLITRNDVMLPTGFLGSGRDVAGVAAFMNMMEADGGAAMKDITRRQGERLARLTNARERVTWQVGNEINSRHFSETMRAWAGEAPCDDGSGSGVPGCRNDSIYIPLYVEYLLAPTVEAIEAASTEVYGSPGEIRIALGSIANASANAAHRWLGELLEYEVRGDFAPTLAGRKVYELVDLVTTHYLVSAGNSEEYRDQLAELYGNWVGVGRIEGIWGTEEVGIAKAENGHGAANGLLTTFRYLDWYLQQGLSPDDGRFSFYGWQQGPDGTQVDDGMDMLHAFAGDQAFTALGAVSADPALESYALQAHDGKVAALVSLRDDAAGGQVSEIRVPGAQDLAGGEARVYSTDGMRTIGVTVAPESDGLLVVLDSPVPLTSDRDDQTSVLFLLE